MNNLFGWINTSLNESASYSLIGDIASEYKKGDDYRRYSSETVSCAAPETYFVESNGIIALYSGKLYFEGESGRGNNGRMGPALEIVRAYLKEGEEFVNRVRGTFSIVLIDKAKEKVILVLDRIGKTSLYYSAPGNGFVFGSNLKDIITHPDVGKGISNQSIYDYIYFHHCPSPETIYKTCRKLEGAQMVVFEKKSIKTKGHCPEQ